MFRYLTVSKDCLKDADGRSKPKQSADALALSSRVEKILLSNDVTRDAARRAMDGREIRDGRVYSIKRTRKSHRCPKSRCCCHRVAHAELHCDNSVKDQLDNDMGIT